MSKPKTFVRNATGLVRAVSPWDAFWFNAWNGGGLWTPIFFLGIMAVLFPQANLILALLIVGVWSTVIGLMYMLNLIAIPRSPSDYVFVGRTLTPAIGLGFSLTLVVWMALLNALGPFTIFSAISDGVFTLGAMLGNQGFASGWGTITGNTYGLLAVGLIIFLIAMSLIFLGLRRYMHSFNRFVTVLGIVTAIIIAIVSLTSTQQDFITRFNTYTSPLAGNSDPYHQIYNLAVQAGYTAPSGFDWGQTLTVSVLWWLFPLFAMPSAWVAGEVQKASSMKLQFLAMSGGQWFTCLIGAAFVWLFTRVIPLNWIGSIAYLALNSPSQLPSWLSATAPAGAYWTLPFISFLSNNAILAAIIILFYIVSGLAFMTPNIIGASRQIFGWSYDRLIPDAFSNVSPRFQSPVYAIIVVGVITMIGFSFSILTTYLSIAVGAVMGVAWAFVAVAIATIVFSSRRKSLYEMSGLKSFSIGGVPLHPIIGVLSLAILLSAIYTFFGPLNLVALGGTAISVTELSIILFALGVIGYYAARAIRSRNGIDLKQIFQEIPPE